MTIFQAHNFGNNIVTIYLMLRVCVWGGTVVIFHITPVTLTSIL